MTHHPRRRRYQHAEAFCLLTYVAVDGSGDREVVFNSRDGVTPFVISLRDGREARHAMALAVRDPGYVPPPGSRIFVDLTPERARQHAARNVATWWDDPELGPMARRRWPTQQDAAVAMATEYLRLPGSPDLVEVPASPAEAGEVTGAGAPGDRIPGRDA